MLDLTIIVPVYNDRESIVPLKNEIAESIEDAPFIYELLFVDDGSKDNPQEIFEEHGLRYVRHSCNRGYGAAIKTGVLASNSVFICIIDCDGTYHPKDIVEMMSHTATSSVVVGKRDPKQNPWQAYLGKRISCFLLGSVFKREVADINSGLRIIRKEIFMNHLPALRERFSLTSSLTYGHLLRGEPIRYIPITYRKRQGTTKVRRLSFVIEFLKCLASVRNFWMTNDVCRSSGTEEQEGITSPNITWIWTLAIFLVSLLIGMAYDWQKLFNPYIVNDDVRQHVFWMSSLHDPQLFPHSVIVDYAKYLTQPGLEAIYWLGTFIWDPVFFGKLLAIVLFALTGAIVYLIGNLAMDRLCGIITSFFFVCYPPLTFNFDGGMHRSFMYPLLALFVYLLIRRHYTVCIWLLGVQFLFYPVCGVLSLSTFFLALLLDKSGRSTFAFRRSTAIGIVFIVACLAVIAVQKKSHQPDFLGERYSASEMMRDGAFDRDGGRHDYLPFRSVSYYVEKSLLRNEYYFKNNIYFKLLIFLFPFFLLLEWILAKRDFSLWPVLLALAVTSVVFFEAAKVFFFNLYIPDRYIIYSFSLLGTLLAGFGASGVFHLIRPTCLRWTCAVALFGIFILVCAHSKASYLPHHLVDETKNTKFYQYLRITPKDVVIAANPFLSDNIQTFSYRQTFLTYELAHAWYKEYRKIMDKRVQIFYKSYFSADTKKIADFMTRNGLSHIVGRKSDFHRHRIKRMIFFYKPLESKLRANSKKWMRSDFALPRVALRHSSYNDDSFFVIPTDSILSAIQENL